MVFVGVDFLKARPATEGDRRYLYFGASNESWDQQQEKILKAALLGSQDLYLAKGNIDIDHITMLGHRLGIKNPREWEIGVPLEVREGPRSVFVKGEIYRGNDKADWFWKTVTAQDPPMRWFPSVGGLPIERRVVTDPATKTQRRVITKARWVNTALAREPIDLSVSNAQVVPYGEFAKSVQYAIEYGVVCGCDESGTCACVVKAMTAGHGTDSAALTGGAALRRQSIEGRPFDATAQHAARFLQLVGTGACEHTTPPMTHEKIREYFAQCEGLAEPEARRTALYLLNTIDRRRGRQRED
jgi:hypothetical protein